MWCSRSWGRLERAGSDCLVRALDVILVEGHIRAFPGFYGISGEPVCKYFLYPNPLFHM
jgi:hypothetical protein